MKIDELGDTPRIGRLNGELGHRLFCAKPRGKEKGKKTKRGKEKEREVSRSEENKIATRNEAVVALKISTILFLDRLVQHGENFIVRSPVSFQGTVQVS